VATSYKQKEKIIKIHRKLLKLFELFTEIDAVSYIAQWACITDPCIIKFKSFSKEGLIKLIGKFINQLKQT